MTSSRDFNINTRCSPRRLAILPAGLAMLALWASAPPARALDWTPPEECTAGVTGTEFDDPPIVEYYVGGKSTNDVVSATFGKEQSWATIFVRIDKSDLYLVYVTYTPFLIGYMGYKPNINHLGRIKVALPAAGYSPSKQMKVYQSVVVTVTDPDTQKAMPGASVMWEPYFVGSDPYVTTTDEKGQMTINCYQDRGADGNPVYVVSADGKTQFDINIKMTKSTLLTEKSGSKSKSTLIGYAGN
jgi:hypothetical protein